jgi:uncharacterized protein YdiU (UPF0061 family)
MAAGFAHGVMNTDNMSVLGLTLDYGPYGFLDRYQAGFICNHTDTEGRYAFDQQPGVGMWNCARFGEALFSLLPVEEAQAELDTYWEAFGNEYAGLMRAKLGFRTSHQDDGALTRDLLALLEADGRDYTGFFRGLGDGSTLGTGAAWDAWQARFEARVALEAPEPAERAARMRRANPRYVLRNWMAQEAIAAAQGGEFGLIEELRRLLATPHDDHPGWERYAAPPGPEARHIEVSCSS